MSFQTISDIMTHDVKTVLVSDSLRTAAKLMRDHQIGDVLVTDANQKLVGILTDRDVVVRALADGADPDKVTAGEICSRGQISQLTPDSSIEDAAQLMRDHDVRRIPVVRDGKAVGIVSIGDLARVKEPNSTLADISEAPAQA